MLTLVPVILLGLSLVHAFPTVHRRQDISILAQTQIESYKPYTWYAAAAHCNATSTTNWTCGVNCEANPTFKPVAAGGDGNVTQFWFVGYDPELLTVIAAHQGTNTSEIEPILTDLDLTMSTINSTFFPGLNNSIEVHSGFQDEQAKTAVDVLAAVEIALTQYNTTNVTLIGHSLGAAIALLDAVYLPLHLPWTNVTYRTVTYGMPRVGNQAFADYVDANVTSLTHINNKEDPVPIIPGKFLGYVHPQGEVHINDDGSWNACAGQDNPSTDCSTGDVPNVFVSNETDHDGPYDGVTLFCG